MEPQKPSGSGFFASLLCLNENCPHRSFVEYLRSLIDKGNYIERWEEFTGFVFEYPVYEITLCASLETVSNAVSAGYEKNHFYYNGDDESFVIFISYETGTPLLIKILENMDKFIERYGFTNFYRAYEVLAVYYNQKIAGEMRTHTYDSDVCFKIYSRIEKNNPGIGSLELLEMRLEEYTN
jgi:hypothetical protein